MRPLGTISHEGAVTQQLFERLAGRTCTPIFESNGKGCLGVFSFIGVDDQPSPAVDKIRRTVSLEIIMPELHHPLLAYRFDDPKGEIKTEERLLDRIHAVCRLAVVLSLEGLS